MTERSDVPGTPWVGPASLWAAAGGTLVAMVGVGGSVTTGLLSPAALLCLGPGVVGLVLLAPRSTRRVGLGLATTLMVPVLTVAAIWAGFGLADSWP